VVASAFAMTVQGNFTPVYLASTNFESPQRKQKKKEVAARVLRSMAFNSRKIKALILNKIHFLNNF
jgi:hypothetical protein